MSNTNQFFFTKQKLLSLIADFDSKHPSVPPGMELKGFIFTPGMEETEPKQFKDCAYAFPVYSPNVKAGSDGDIIIQNTNVKYMGCPYPPPCDTKSLADNCYGEKK